MKTIKVRIPVIVTANGNWGASGSNDESEPDWSWMDEMCGFDTPQQRMFVIAELPLPEIGEVEATKVEDA
jgi:hypothetical protein